MYAVTENRLKFLTWSEFSQRISDLIFPFRGRSWIKTIFSTDDLGLQFVIGQVNKSVIMRLEQENGKLVQIVEKEFSNLKKPFSVESSPNFPKSKNSKIEGFVFVNKYLNEQTNLTLFGRKMKGKVKGWFNMTKFFRERQVKEELRLKAQKEAQLPPEYRPMFNFSRTGDAFIFKSEFPGTSVVCYPSVNSITVCLVNLKKRRVILKRSFTLLDFLSFEKIREILNTGNGGQDGGEGGPDEGVDEEVVDIQNLTFHLQKALFHDKTQSVVLDIKVGEKKEIFVKLSNIFNTEDIRKNVKMHFFKNETSPLSLLGEFSEDHFLCSYTGESRSSLLRPLAFLRIEDFAQTKVKGFEESKKFSAMYGAFSFSLVTRLRLNDSKMLIVTGLQAFIYDYIDGRVVDELRHTLDTMYGPTITKTDDLLAFKSRRQFHMIQTEIDEESGAIEVRGVKTIFFNDLVPNMSEKVSRPVYNLFKLQNGNYLMITPVYLEEAFRENPNNPPHHQLSVEISKNDLEVVKSSSRDITGQLKRVRVNYACLVSDLLVFQASPREMLQDGNGGQVGPFADYSLLTLATTDFEILHQCQRAKLPIRVSSIGTVSSNQIVSQGLDNFIYLHEVDAINKKLVLKKSLKIQSGDLNNSMISKKSPHCFSCVANINATEGDPEQSTRSVVLNFNPDLTLRSYVYQTGLQSQKYIFSASKDKLIFSSCGPEAGYRSRQYLLNCHTREIQFVSQSHHMDTCPTYHTDKNGDTFFVEMDNIAIIIVKLN